MWFFEKEENKEVFKRELDEWIGTNFLPNQGGKAVKGGSADCVSFPINVFKNMDLISECNVPPYVSLRSGRGELEKIYSVMNSLKGLELIWKTGNGESPHYMFGDVIVASSGSYVHHVMIYAGNGMIWHCWPVKGVEKTFINPIFKKRVKRIYRFKELNGKE